MGRIHDKEKKKALLDFMSPEQMIQVYRTTYPKYVLEHKLRMKEVGKFIQNGMQWKDHFKEYKK